MLQDIINYILNLPADTWYHAAGFLLTSGLVTAIVQAAKHARGKYTVVTKKFSLGLLGLLSGLATALQAYVGSGISLGNYGKTGLAIAGAATFLYHIVTSPLYKKWFAKAEEAAKPTDEKVLAPDVPLAQGFEG